MNTETEGRKVKNFSISYEFLVENLNEEDAQAFRKGLRLTPERITDVEDIIHVGKTALREWDRLSVPISRRWRWVPSSVRSRIADLRKPKSQREWACTLLGLRVLNLP